MTLETLSSNEFLNFIIHDTLSATPLCSNIGHASLQTSGSVLLETSLEPHQNNNDVASFVCNSSSLMSTQQRRLMQKMGVQARKKRRRRKPRTCKNKEEAETQRMTHIVVERNRRKQMNEHLAVLRSLMPQSYVQRGDQASIVGGAIEYVKELEHLLQSLEAQKLQLQHGALKGFKEFDTNINKLVSTTPFGQFFAYPQYTWSQIPTKFTSKPKASIADIEVTLIETHANIRILSRKTPSHFFKLINRFHSLYLTILHTNLTSMDPLVLYSISAKLEEECQLTSVDDIAAAIHRMLTIIEEEEQAEAALG